MTLPDINYQARDEPLGVQIQADYVKRRFLSVPAGAPMPSHAEIERRLHELIARDLYHQPADQAIKVLRALKEVFTKNPMFSQKDFERVSAPLSELLTMLTQHESRDPQWR